MLSIACNLSGASPFGVTYGEVCMYWNLYQKQTKGGRQTLVPPVVSLKVFTPCLVVMTGAWLTQGNPGSHLLSSRNYSWCPFFLPNCSGLDVSYTVTLGISDVGRGEERAVPSGCWLLCGGYVCGSAQLERKGKEPAAAREGTETTPVANKHGPQAVFESLN